MTPRRLQHLAGAAALAALLAVPGAVRAQYDQPPPPAAYALEDVTVVRADGSTLSGVNVVVRGGLIESMGADAVVPADAELLEGDSLVVYPGFVDGHGAVEVSWPERGDDEDEGPSWDPTRAQSGFMPHRRVAHHLADRGEDLDDPRAEGIVAALIHPTGGMAPGQSAVVVYRKGADTPWELVDVESSGLAMSFQAASGVYPSQLFGVIAYLRQAFMDAARYETMRTTYLQDPSGMTSPPWDPDFEAIRRAARGEIPVFFHADSDEDVRRVLDLSDEFGFRPVIAGGAEAWKLADELARRQVPVLVSMDWPLLQDYDPEEDTVAADMDPSELREKEMIENVWSNAERLEAAGVSFALTTGGGDGDLLEGARKAVEFGLSPDAALRALTATPASLVQRPGLVTLAPGMGATFVVTDGDLFHEETGVAYTFVEGEMEMGAAAPGGEADGEAPATDVSGQWEAQITAGGQDLKASLTLTMEEDGSLEGRISSTELPPSDLSGSVSGTSFTLRFQPEGMPEPLSISGSVSEDGTTMTGSGSTPFGPLEFAATKSPGGGTWGGASGGGR